ncbi:hypothetical protein ACQP0I_30185 [Micromonospora carbonacea]|uniref:hypothetical protein n=1 Tax=Micromonospora carbonacea TaxID=47853 RepID=UPI003D975C01
MRDGWKTGLTAGTRLSLPAGGWATHAEQLCDTDANVVVVEVGDEPAGLPGWVRLRGHAVDCRLDPTCPHPWCLELLVRAEALRDAATQR